MENPQNKNTISPLNDDEVRRRIVEKAVDLFNERGLRGVTMDNIAGAIHISKRTLYEKFDNKEELITECLMLVHQRLMESHRNIARQVDEPLLLALFAIQTASQSKHRYRNLITTTERYYPEIHERFFRSLTTQMRQLVQQGLAYAEKGNYLRPGVDLPLTIDAITRFMQSARPPEMDDDQQYAHYLSSISFTFIRGLMSVETLERYEREEDHLRKLFDQFEQQCLANTKFAKTETY